MAMTTKLNFTQKTIIKGLYGESGRVLINMLVNITGISKHILYSNLSQLQMKKLVSFVYAGQTRRANKAYYLTEEGKAMYHQIRKEEEEQ